MNVRKIIHIDEEKCDGCGLCLPNCAEGALKIVNGKAKLVSDEFCDGLGACLGHCPQDAIAIVERKAIDFDEEAVKKQLTLQAEESVNKEVQEEIPCSCPSSMILDRREEEPSITAIDAGDLKSELRQWPIQLKLVPSQAPYFQNADLLIAADCVPFAYAGFHQEFLKGKVLVMGCPKLDDAPYYTEKLMDILKSNDIKSVTLLNMEVPCCYGLQQITEEAIAKSGKSFPLNKVLLLNQ